MVPPKVELGAAEFPPSSGSLTSKLHKNIPSKHMYTIPEGDDSPGGAGSVLEREPYVLSFPLPGLGPLLAPLADYINNHIQEQMAGQQPWLPGEREGTL